MFIHASFLPTVPVFSWMKLTLVEEAIRVEQCYGAPYSHFIGPQWYFIDAWNNVSVQPKQAIWKTLEKLKVFENAWEHGCNGYCRRASPKGIHGIQFAFVFTRTLVVDVQGGTSRYPTALHACTSIICKIQINHQVKRMSSWHFICRKSSKCNSPKATLLKNIKLQVRCF